MRYSVFTVSVLGMCSGCWGEEGNGDRVTQIRDVAEVVTEIGNYSPFDVDISQGDKFEVRVSIDSNLQRFVGTQVSHGQLRIEFDDRISEMVSGPHVLVTVPRASAILNAGRGNVFAAWFEQENDIELYVSGAGDLSFEGAVPRIRTMLSGPGSLRLGGDTDFADITIDGEGDIDGSDLTAAAAVIDMRSSGDLRLRVDGKVDAQVNGSGDATLSGDVQRGRFSETGSGHIRVH